MFMDFGSVGIPVVLHGVEQVLTLAEAEVIRVAVAKIKDNKNVLR